MRNFLTSVFTLIFTNLSASASDPLKDSMAFNTMRTLSTLKFHEHAFHDSAPSDFYNQTFDTAMYRDFMHENQDSISSLWEDNLQSSSSLMHKDSLKLLTSDVLSNLRFLYTHRININPDQLSAIWNSHNLEYLHLSTSPNQGIIPKSVGNLHKIQFLDFAFNVKDFPGHVFEPSHDLSKRRVINLCFKGANRDGDGLTRIRLNPLIDWVIYKGRSGPTCPHFCINGKEIRDSSDFKKTSDILKLNVKSADGRRRILSFSGLSPYLTSLGFYKHTTLQKTSRGDLEVININPGYKPGPIVHILDEARFSSSRAKSARK